MEDPQVGLRLLRNCAGICKVNHSMRMTPTNLQSTALASFDDRIRDVFSHITGIMPNDEQWNQATSCLSLAGLGL